jgi:YVTN family beta-propeller protein
MFPSAQAGLDGDLYISGGYDRKVYRLNQFFEIVRDYSVSGYAAGLAAIDSGHIAVAYMVTKNSQNIYDQGRLAILNTFSGEVEREVTLGYFPHTVRYANGKLYVTLLGENKLQIYDAKQLGLIKALPVGRTPQDICVDGERLYVVNTGSDDLTVIDTKTDTVASTITLHNGESRFGSAPSSCAVEGNRLYVTQTYTNSVAVLDKASGKQLGLIPTGWYPAKTLLNKSQLFVLNAKGIHNLRLRETARSMCSPCSKARSRLFPGIKSKPASLHGHARYRKARRSTARNADSNSQFVMSFISSERIVRTTR